MGSLSDEACSSCTPPATSGSVINDRRREAIDQLHEALVRHGTALDGAELRWISAKFEAELHVKSSSDAELYESLIFEKLRELSRKDGPSGPAQALPAPVQKNGTCTGAGAQVEGRPAGASLGISHASWQQVQWMKAQYFLPLQAFYVALVASVGLGRPSAEVESVKPFKRLVLSLVLFLSARQERIPARFTAERLMRLEKEILQILSTLLTKSRAGVLILPGGVLEGLEVKVGEAMARLGMRKGEACYRPSAGSRAAELRLVSHGVSGKVLGKHAKPETLEDGCPGWIQCKRAHVGLPSLEASPMASPVKGESDVQSSFSAESNLLTPPKYAAGNQVSLVNQP